MTPDYDTRSEIAARLEGIDKMVAEWATVDKRKRSELEAFANRFCLSVAECGAWSDSEQKVVDMTALTFAELQFEIKVIEMDVRLDRHYDAINSRF